MLRFFTDPRLSLNSITLFLRKVLIEVIEKVYIKIFYIQQY